MRPGDDSRLWIVARSARRPRARLHADPAALAHLRVEPRLRLHGLHDRRRRAGRALRRPRHRGRVGLHAELLPDRAVHVAQINKADDMVAFGALAVCGLIAAAFGRRREQMSEQAERAGDELEVLDKLVGRLRAGAPLDEVLEDLRKSFGLPRDRPARRRRAPGGGGPRRAGALPSMPRDGHRPRYLPPRR